MHRTSRSAALATLALLVLAGSGAAQGAPSSAPLVLVDVSGGISLRETPLTFTVGDVLTASLRAGVPLRYGIEPWVDGALSRLRNVPCDSVGPDCSDTERRLLVGVMYQPGGRGEGEGRVGGPYLGLGLGVRSFRGHQDLAHSIVLGLPLGAGSALAPVIELRSESYRGFTNELLIVAVGARLGVGG